ncbi:MAG: membrane integrity-associated transporter subunit PqiC [Gammaproteobacteria bacterium]|nr:membrane integrity-associated transporter subunit PqiC [Gammaproteobacteria bacterium]MBI5615377.1 membrane integrity-associated transporter subunit PqiC [Gammaproteobacteria bacterium]
MRRVLFALVLSLAACGTIAPIPTDTFYRLTVPAPRPLAKPWCAGPIEVESLQAGGLLKDRAIVEADSRGVALRQLPYHFWVDSPEHLIAHELVAYLRALRAAPIVLAGQAESAAYEVRGRVLRFERQRSGEHVRARVGLELVLVERRQGRVLLAREYDESSDVATTSVADAVAALGTGVGAAFGDFAADSDRLLSGAAAPDR